MKPLIFRIGNIELRTCDKHLLQRSKFITVEIVKRFLLDSSTITLCYWDERIGEFSETGHIFDIKNKEEKKIILELKEYGRRYILANKK